MSRYKGRTYGENMILLDNDDDYRYWKRRYKSAIDAKDYEKIEELLSEAKIFEYDIPSTSDPEVTKIMNKVFKKKQK